MTALLFPKPNRTDPWNLRRLAQSFLLLGIAMLASACAHHHHGPIGTNYLVGPECHPTARLLDCDHDSPPHCKKAMVRFDKACEQIDLKP